MHPTGKDLNYHSFIIILIADKMREKLIHVFFTPNTKWMTGSFRSFN